MEDFQYNFQYMNKSDGLVWFDILNWVRMVMASKHFLVVFPHQRLELNGTIQTDFQFRLVRSYRLEYVGKLHISLRHHKHRDMDQCIVNGRMPYLTDIRYGQHIVVDMQGEYLDSLAGMSKLDIQFVRLGNDYWHHMVNFHMDLFDDACLLVAVVVVTVCTKLKHHPYDRLDNNKLENDLLLGIMHLFHMPQHMDWHISGSSKIYPMDNPD